MFFAVGALNKVVAPSYSLPPSLKLRRARATFPHPSLIRGKEPQTRVNLQRYVRAQAIPGVGD